jgi:Cof subfamily protein (haloacid dehalogenase superfamily)
MPGTPIKLVLADVDGTLVTEQKELTERARAAVRRCRERGVKFAITSGRPPKGMEMLVEPLALDTPIAGFNGGVFVNPDLSVLEEHALDPKVARQAIEVILKHGMDAWLYTPMDWFIHKKDAPHVAREEWTVKFAPKVVDPFRDEDLDRAVKIVGISDDHDLVGKCEAAMRQALGEHASAARSQPYYLDVTHPNANKGGVVAWLSARLGIDPAAICTLGDQPNDVLMFEKSGFSIAMGNAGDDVKHRASAVTDSHQDEGFAKAIERFILAPAERGA